MNEYIRLDRLSDACASLDEFCHCVQRLLSDDNDQSAWKWAVISLDNALQGCMCAGFQFHQRWKSKGTQSNPGYREWLQAYDQGDLPKCWPKQDVFKSLYEKYYGNNERLDWEIISSFHGVRNGLIHFDVDGWSIPKEKLIHGCIEVLKAIKQAPGYAKKLFFYEETQKLAYQSACDRGQRLLNLLNNNLKQEESNER